MAATTEIIRSTGAVGSKTGFSTSWMQQIALLSTLTISSLQF